MPATFAICEFDAPAKTNTVPIARTLTFDELVTLLTTHEVLADKDEGPGWTGATYTPGTTRAKVNVKGVSVFVADLDHIRSEDWLRIRERLVGQGLAFIRYSTYSHTEEAPRFRVVLPLTKPIPADQYPENWQRLTAHLFDEKNDPQTKDASRMFYLPAATPGGAGCRRVRPRPGARLGEAASDISRKGEWHRLTRCGCRHRPADA